MVSEEKVTKREEAKTWVDTMDKAVTDLAIIEMLYPETTEEVQAATKHMLHILGYLYVKRED